MAGQAKIARNVRQPPARVLILDRTIGIRMVTTERLRLLDPAKSLRWGTEKRRHPHDDPLDVEMRSWSEGRII